MALHCQRTGTGVEVGEGVLVGVAAGVGAGVDEGMGQPAACRVLTEAPWPSTFLHQNCQVMMRRMHGLLACSHATVMNAGSPRQQDGKPPVQVDQGWKKASVDGMHCHESKLDVLAGGSRVGAGSASWGSQPSQRASRATLRILSVPAWPS